MLSSVNRRYMFTTRLRTHNTQTVRVCTVHPEPGQEHVVPAVGRFQHERVDASTTPRIEDNLGQAQIEASKLVVTRTVSGSILLRDIVYRRRHDMFR